MANPQQPELARSRKTPALDPDATESVLSAAEAPTVDPAFGPVPADNRPGHHPRVEQDKPSGEAFLEKLHEHAADVDTGVRDDDGDDDDSAGDGEYHSERADRVAEAVGKPFEAAADILQKVRDKLGD